MNDKKLYKKRSNKMLSGVCSGIADYFNVDVTLIRLGWILISFFTTCFPGLIAYIICACVMPNDPDENVFQGNGAYNGNYQQQPPYQAPQNPQNGAPADQDNQNNQTPPGQL